MGIFGKFDDSFAGKVKTVILDGHNLIKVGQNLEIPRLD